MNQYPTSNIKKFWFNMAALATTVIVGFISPPAGMVLGATLGGYEMLNAARPFKWS